MSFFAVLAVASAAPGAVQYAAGPAVYAQPQLAYAAQPQLAYAAQPVLKAAHPVAYAQPAVVAKQVAVSPEPYDAHPQVSSTENPEFNIEITSSFLDN